MPKWITAVFVFFLSTTLLTAKAITVEDVINRHMEAIRSGKIGAGEAEILKSYSDKEQRVLLQGLENVKGRPCYHLRVERKSGLLLHYLIDAENWYIIRKYIEEKEKSIKPSPRKASDL